MWGKHILATINTDNIQTKPCEQCGFPVYRKYKYPKKQWEDVKYCSYKCSGINTKIRNTGKITSQEVRDKISSANTGKKKVFTEDHKNNIKRSFTQTIRNNLRNRMLGENNPAWRGGVTDEHKIIRCSAQYRAWRESVYRRDNWMCVLCCCKGGKLNADHIKPFSMYPELRFSVENGRTLCVDCHRKTDTFGIRALKTTQ